MRDNQKLDLMRNIIEEYLEFGQANEDRANTVILVLDTIIRYDPNENTKK